MTVTHVYIGPSTIFGLVHNTKCRLLGKRAGGRRIETADGRRWLVAPHELLALL